MPQKLKNGLQTWILWLSMVNLWLIVNLCFVPGFSFILRSRWFPHQVYCDWDMLKTSEWHCNIHAVARAVAGCPVYVSDTADDTCAARSVKLRREGWRTGVFFVKPKLYTVRILGRFIWGILPNKWWLGIAGRQEPMSGHFGLFVSNMFHFQATSRLVPTCSNIFQMYVSKLSPRLKDNSMTELWRPHHDVTIFDGEYCKGIRQSPAKWLNRSVHSNYIYGWWFGL